MTVPPLDGLLDLAVARAALASPSTQPGELSQIAQYHPTLRAEVAMHSAAYPGLLDWLDDLGDPVISAVVNVRRHSSGSVAETAPVPAQPVALASPAAAAGLRPPASYPSTSHAVPFQAVAPAAPSHSARSAKRLPRKLLIGTGALVLAIALTVSAFATRGFGVFPAGGAATPEEEAVKVATKAVDLFNSFSAANLLSNPLSAMSSLTDEYAPSEARVIAHPGIGSGSGSGNSVLDTTDLLGLTGESLSLVTDIAGSFKVQAIDVKAEVTEITADIAAVSFVDGTVSVTADADKFRQALEKVPDVVGRQIAATSEKYGLHPNSVAVGDYLPEGWLDNAVGEVRDRFPVTVNLADYDRWLHSGGAEAPPSSGIASIYSQISAVIVVKENGRWYLSPMLTSYAWSNGIAVSLKDFRPDADDKRLLNVEPSQNKSPVEAATAFAEALSSGRERSLLAELPLAERRYAAFTAIGPSTGILGQMSTMEASERPEVKVSEIGRNGDQVKLRIDEYSPVYTANGSPVSIEDGTCVSSGGETHCLSDYLDSGSVADAIDGLRDAPWGSFEDNTGISPDDIVDRLEAAAQRAIEAVKPDQIGVVVVQEDGNWFVSATATVGELQNQANVALAEGLKAAQK